MHRHSQLGPSMAGPAAWVRPFACSWALLSKSDKSLACTPSLTAWRFAKVASTRPRWSVLKKCVHPVHGCVHGPAAAADCCLFVASVFHRIRPLSSMVRAHVQIYLETSAPGEHTCTSMSLETDSTRAQRSGLLQQESMGRESELQAPAQIS